MVIKYVLCRTSKTFQLVCFEYLSLIFDVANGTQGEVASCKGATPLPPPPPPRSHPQMVCSAEVPVLVLLFVALWFILRGDLFYVLPCVILFLCFSVPLALRLLRLGKIELILVLFVHLFNLRLFDFVCFLFLLVSGKGCGLWLWYSLDFSLTFFVILRLF